MGKQIVYCGSCGGILQQKDFARGLAHTQDHRHYCARCRSLHVPAPTPPLPVALRVAPTPRPFTRLGR